MVRGSKNQNDAHIVTLVGRLEDGTHVVRHSNGDLERRSSQTDWARVDALTDDDIAEAVATDPDAVPIDLDWSKAALITFAKKQPISIRVDQDVLDFFKSQGLGYQRKINAVLRSFMEQTSKPKKRA